MRFQSTLTSVLLTLATSSTTSAHTTDNNPQFYEFTFIVNNDFTKPEYAYPTQFAADDGPSGYNGTDYPGYDVAWTVNANTSPRLKNGKKQSMNPVYFLPSTVGPHLLIVNSNTTFCGKTACQLCQPNCAQKAGFLSTCADGTLPAKGQHCGLRQISDIDGDGYWKYDNKTHEVTNVKDAAPKYHFFSCDYKATTTDTTQRLDIGQLRDDGSPPAGCNRTKIVALPKSHDFFGSPFNGVV